MPVVSVVKGTLDIIRHVPYIFRKETSNGGVCTCQMYPREPLKGKMDVRHSAHQNDASALVEETRRSLRGAM